MRVSAVREVGARGEFCAEPSSGLSRRAWRAVNRVENTPPAGAKSQ
jgi:hypothetical protein